MTASEPHERAAKPLDRRIADGRREVARAGEQATVQEAEHSYLCIDLKSFYASVECVDRGFDPFATNLVVADPSRGRSTICLAITPAMKELGVRNRCRMFEIPGNISYLTARPNMRHYMEVSVQIYGLYLEYVSARDVHVYSVDECFIDIAPYLSLYDTTPHAFARTLMAAVFSRTGISATVGIGTNLFLAKVALDITAKHASDRIGYLDERTFRRVIWPHRPITDIWGIGPGIAARLERYGVRDLMGAAALDETILYREFGVTAEYLIDHAFGREPCTIADIKRYEPSGASLVNGQVLPESYRCDELRNVMHEMIDVSVLDLVERRVLANRISLHVGYADRARGRMRFIGEHGAQRLGRCDGADRSGRSRTISRHTNSRRGLMACFDKLFDETVDPTRCARRISVGFGNLLPEDFVDVDLFCDTEGERRERELQRTVIAVKRRFGGNSLLKGANFATKATGRERNEQIGGHHA